MILEGNNDKITIEDYKRRAFKLPTFRTVAVPELAISIGIRPKCCLRRIFPYFVGDNFEAILEINSLAENDTVIDYRWALSRFDGSSYTFGVTEGDDTITCKGGINEIPLNISFLIISGDYDFKILPIKDGDSYGWKALCQFHLVDKDVTLLNIYLALASALIGGIIGACLAKLFS